MDWGACTSKGAAEIKCLEVIVERLITFAAGLATIVFFLMLIYGGFRWMTAGGNPKGMEAAKGTITAAFFGIVLIVGAYIMLVILEYFTGVDLTTFVIQQF